MTRFSLVLAALVVLLLPAAQPMNATTLLFTTNGPQTLGNSGPEVNAEALFNVDPTNHRITVTVLDLEANPSDVSQLIASVQFTVSNVSSISGSLTVQGSDTTEVDVANHAATTTTPLDVAWIAHAAASNVVELCTICGNHLAGDAPQELLIGDPNSSKLYSNANGSINGNSSHNPFLLASGTSLLSGLSGYTGSSPQFRITLPQLTPTSRITAVTFGFGTNYGKYTFAATEMQMESTPEPESWALLAIGILLICAGRLRASRVKGTPTER